MSFLIKQSSVLVKMKNIVFLVVIATMTLAFKHEVISLQQFASLSPAQMQESTYVEVIHSTEISTQHTLKRDYYVMKVTHKDKRSAYEDMKRLENKVQHVLKKHNVIPHEGSLVKSKIKPQYLAKKRQWAFSTIFVIFGDQHELRHCYRQLRALRVQKLNAQPSIDFLNEKLQALEIFAVAKAQLQAQLTRFPGYQIKQIEEIEIEGMHMPNSDLIERQIEEEFSDSEENMEQSQIRNGAKKGVREHLTVRVVFVVQEKDDNEEASQQEMEELEDDDSDCSEDQTAE